MNNQHLSAYTPSNMDTDTLEAMFVQRHKLLEQSIQWVEESLFSGKKNHLLFVGPRGSGKTHLVTMIIRRLAAKHGDDFIYVWLGEDDVIMNFTSLALALINKMASAYPEQFNNDCLADAKGKKPDDVADIILADIKAQAGDKTLLIVKENMSDVFAGLKDLGQNRLRAHLQENSHLSILGTSQKLFDGISSRNSAFWGFFDVHHLSTLSVDDATQLISNIATINGDDELVTFLASSQGNYRIRALHYLAGGNHRLYVELASFLTKTSLDDFVDAITQLADHLTPYFQERIRSLSPQQAGIIQKLCELSGAIQVKIIAESLFIDERAVASQLKELKEMGYVIAHKRGRASYYEIAEPLLRLSLEVKNNHGKPLKIIASLFRAWFSDEELRTNSNDHLMEAYRKAALSNPEILSNIKNAITIDLLKEFIEFNHEKVISLSAELQCVPSLSGDERAMALYSQTFAYINQDEIASAIDSLTQVIDMPESPRELIAKTLLHRSAMHSNQDNIGLALSDLTQLIDIPNAPSEQIAKALLNRSFIYSIQDRVDLELSDLTQLINMPDAPSETIAKALLNRSIVHVNQDNIDFALSDLTQLIGVPDAPSEQIARALFSRSVINSIQDKIDSALLDLAAIVKLNDAPSGIKNLALFRLPEMHYLQLEKDKARQSLKEAFSKGDRNSDDYPCNSEDIVVSVLRLGASHWQHESKHLIDMYAQYESLSHLSAGLTHSIEAFIIDNTLHSSFTKWAELWESACDTHPEMQPAVDALLASAEALAEGNDKPLFALPKEVRDLVRPMFDTIFEES